MMIKKDLWPTSDFKKFLKTCLIFLWVVSDCAKQLSNILTNASLLSNSFKTINIRHEYKLIITNTLPYFAIFWNFVINAKWRIKYKIAISEKENLL